MQRKGMRTPNRSMRTQEQRDAEDRIADEQVKKGKPGKVARRNARTAVGSKTFGTQRAKKTGEVGKRVAEKGGKKAAQKDETRRSVPRSSATKRKAGGMRRSHRSGRDAR